jgi:hypothetical protein
MVICFDALHFTGIIERSSSSHYAAMKYSTWNWTNQIICCLVSQSGSCHTIPLSCLPWMVTALSFCYCNSWRTSSFIHVEQIYFSSILFCKLCWACWMTVKDGVFLHILPSSSIQHYSSKASSECMKYILSNYVVLICYPLRANAALSDKPNDEL